MFTAHQSLVGLVENLKETFSRHVARLEVVRAEKAKRQQAIEGALSWLHGPWGGLYRYLPYKPPNPHTMHTHMHMHT